MTKRRKPKPNFFRLSQGPHGLEFQLVDVRLRGKTLWQKLRNPVQVKVVRRWQIDKKAAELVRADKLEAWGKKIRKRLGIK